MPLDFLKKDHGVFRNAKHSFFKFKSVHGPLTFFSDDDFLQTFAKGILSHFIRRDRFEGLN